jgi:hypothetical protein
MEQTLFFHGKTTTGRRFTIAGQFVKVGKLIKKDFLSLGVSICSPKDSFIKKVGRFKAEHRLNAKKGHIIVPVDIEKAGTIKAFNDYASTFMTMDIKDIQKTFNLHGER